MGFCEHCEGQRFDRARVLRALREAQRHLRGKEAAGAAGRTLASAIEAVRTLDIPHLELLDEVGDDEIIH
jgi:hypothetical protein